MAIPDGQTLTSWLDEIVGEMLESHRDLEVFRKYWAQFTATQKIQIKNKVSNDLDSTITNLNSFKEEIQSL